ncbi:hypothetical protein BDQ17DRAFT_1424428 [Cyathus striatus]|nr:hypothetical protein BDQ17DRAFT_1424428 [Cyathus striatus]
MISVWDISNFLRLDAIRLDWLSRTLIPYWISPEDPPERIPFTNPSCHVVEFDIRGLSWPSPHAFKLVSYTLQDLKIFRMRQRRIWCGLCHTCCEPRFLPPGPDKIAYTDGLGLPIHYAQALSQLKHLEEVYITVPDAGKGKTLLADNGNPHMWAGECDRCMEIMYEDNTFREKWVSRKRGIGTGESADGTVYIRPPSLRRVEWHFLKSAPVEAELSEAESGGEDSVLEAEIEGSTDESDASDIETEEGP